MPGIQDAAGRQCQDFMFQGPHQPEAEEEEGEAEEFTDCKLGGRGWEWDGLIKPLKAN